MAKLLFGFFLGLLLMYSGQVFGQTTERPIPKIGPDFKIGPFTVLVRKVTEGGKEEDCAKLQQAIAMTLQDMQRHMTPRALSLGYGARWKDFEVNQETLDLFCNKRAMIVLRNKQGNELMLIKTPFQRTVDPRTNDDPGTMIFIGAAIVPKGGTAPKQPDEYGQIFMPDRLVK